MQDKTFFMMKKKISTKCRELITDSKLKSWVRLEYGIVFYLA